MAGGAGTTCGQLAVLQRALHRADPPRHDPQHLVQDKVTLRKDLADPLARLQQAAKRIAQVQKECKLPVDEQEYLESFRPYLMDVVHAWSKVRAAGHTQHAHTTLRCPYIGCMPGQQGALAMVPTPAGRVRPGDHASFTPTSWT